MLKDSHPYKCRFCGKQKTAKDFKKVAHVLSRCIGNNTLFSTYECDLYESEEPIAEIDEDTKNVKVQGKRSYVPVLVYKALVKMALSVLAESEMVNYPTTLACLQGVDLKNKFMVKYKMFGGYHRFSDVTLVGMKRRDDCKNNVPACIF